LHHKQDIGLIAGEEVYYHDFATAVRDVIPLIRYDTIEEINVDSKAEYTA